MTLIYSVFAIFNASRECMFSCTMLKKYFKKKQKEKTELQQQYTFCHIRLQEKAKQHKTKGNETMQILTPYNKRINPLKA